jgi:hypothetical protein
MKRGEGVFRDGLGHRNENRMSDEDSEKNIQTTKEVTKKRTFRC